MISKITSQFPSTTAPHVVSIHSGCPVGESGIYEWYMYDPKLDSIISPLLFNFAGSEERNTLQNAGLQPGDLFPHRSLYKELKTENITSLSTRAGTTPLHRSPRQHLKEPRYCLSPALLKFAWLCYAT